MRRYLNVLKQSKRDGCELSALSEILVIPRPKENNSGHSDVHLAGVNPWDNIKV